MIVNTLFLLYTKCFTDMPTIIFKETEACNANCIYCNVIRRKKPLTISKELLEVVLLKVHDYLTSFPNERMTIIWHGGEPCIVGSQFYKNVLDFLRKNCHSTFDRMDFSVQSNLTLINQELIDVFKEMGIDMIGTSFEPYSGIRGLGPNRDSNLYNEKFFKGIELLERNNMYWGFIYVVTKQVLDKPFEVFNLLQNFSCCRGFNIHYVYSINHEDPNNVLITPTEFADFLGTLCPEWWLKRNVLTRVDPFESYYEKYTGTNKGLVCTDANCAYSHLYIGPSGELSHCGRSSEWDLFKAGNIKDLSIEEAFNLPYRKTIKERDNVLLNGECNGCEYFHICHGGCPLDGWNVNGDVLSQSEWCLSTKYFLRKYFEPITGLKLL